jgi:excisionase family DNA binding protein
MIELPTLDDIRTAVADNIDELAAAARPVWMTVGQYAAYLQVSESTVRRLIAEGSVVTTRMGPQTVRINREVNDARLTSNEEEL